MSMTRLMEMAKPTLCGPRVMTLLTVLVLTTAGAFAADPTTHSVQGTVTDRTGNPVEGAAIVVDGSTLAATDANGTFSLDLAAGVVVIQVTHPAYRPLRHELAVYRAISEVRLELSPPMSVSESITVTAIRAGDDAPVTKTNLDREQIEELSYGQDVPQMLQYTPSLTWYSDSGIGSNYSYFSLRGVQQTRINMTFDGAPLNDPAEHALYFNNFHDFTSAVDSIQVQRGVGTSTVGSPSYGGSVNFASNPLSQSPQGDVQLAFGSYDTLRASAAYETGVFDNGLAFSGRVSYASTDGYRDSSGTEHHTFFLNGEWQGERSTLKFVSFFGNEKTQLAWLAVDPDTLAVNPRFNELTEDDRDNFGQDFAQLQYTRAIGQDTLLVASVYYNGADGWYRLWGEDYGIDQHFVGTMLRMSKTTDRLSFTGGVHYNDFQGDHTLDIEDQLIYKNTGFKKTANAFAKAEYRVGPWLLFGDLHLRWAEFSYEGDIDLGSVDWTFIDPKIGARLVLSDRLSVYASIGKAEREPARLDMLAGEDNASQPYDLTAVKPEEVVDLEIGVNYNSPRLALQAGLYAMDFDNEIALTGELSAVGYPIRRNVEDSFRRGVELDLRWLVGRNWAIINNSTLSHNRISTWTQYVDVFDSGWNWIGSEPITSHDVPPLLTPEVIINQGVEWFPGDTRVSLTGRFIDSSYLDNTGTDELRAPSYFNLDLRASHTFSRWQALGRPTIALYINNLLDTIDQYPSGYSWQYIVRDSGGNDSLSGIPYYYPLATRNFVVTLDFKL
jgi:iron complex outermembrane receptor protein